MRFLSKKGSTHLAAPPGRQFVSHTILKVAKKLIVEISSQVLKKCAFTCNLALFNTLVM